MMMMMMMMINASSMIIFDSSVSLDSRIHHALLYKELSSMPTRNRLKIRIRSAKGQLVLR
jgi:hypothetical protein